MMGDSDGTVWCISRPVRIRTFSRSPYCSGARVRMIETSLRSPCDSQR